MDTASISTPADVPPPGVEPNFDGCNPLFSIILTTTLLCGILTTLFASARLITKRIVSSFNVEDCTY